VLSWLLVPLPVWVFAALGAWRHRQVLTMRVVLAVGALPVATALVFFVQPRYLMLTAALATVPAGAAIAWFRSRWRPVIAAAVVVLLALSTVQGFKGPGGCWHPSDHTDQRAAGEWLTEAADEFVELVKWRTGAEGRIAALKRRHGWNRARLRGLAGTRTWCRWGVLCHNAIKIAALTR
jgi:IS5 family transposase